MMKVPIAIDVKVSGTAFKIRKEDMMLVKDLRLKMIPEEKIAEILKQRQS